MTKRGASGRRWFWLRDLVIPAGQAASETIPLYAVAALVGATAQQTLALSYILLTAIVAVPAWLTRLTGLLPRTYHFDRLVLGLLTVVCLVAWVHGVLAPDAAWDPHTTALVVSRPWLIDPTRDGQLLFAAWFLAIALCSRGLWIGIEPISVQQEARWFVGGIAVLLVTIAAVTASPKLAETAGFLRITLLWYFFVGLLVLALAHATSLRAAGGAAPGASLSWLFAVAIPIAAIPLVGLLFTVGATRAVRLAMQAGTAAALLVWRVLLWLGWWLLLFIQWLLSLFPRNAEQTAPAQPPCRQPPEWLLHLQHWLMSWFRSGSPPPATGPSGCVSQAPTVEIPDIHSQLAIPSFDATAAFVVVVFCLLLGLLAYLLTRRRAAVDAPGPGDERSSAWSWALFLSQVKSLWSRLLRAWRPRRAPGQSSVQAALAARGRSAEEDVRGLYRRFLRRAAELNHRRPPAATPLEFARSLTRAAPGSATDIAVITDSYDRARYGSEDVSPQRLASVRAALGRFETPATEIGQTASSAGTAPAKGHR
jgi:hypothetical protein